MAEPIFGQLYRFTVLNGQLNLPVNQYLLASEPSIMFATGSYDQASWILPQISEILGNRPLNYLFVSHSESDECGGVQLFHKKYPDMTVLCSSFTANELKGHGFRGRIVVCDEGSHIRTCHGELRFVRYPAEVHLKDGLLVIETDVGFIYSADLFAHRVSRGTKIISSSWKNEVGTIDASQIPDDARRERLKNSLLEFSPTFIATGHGSCIELQPDMV